MRILKSFGYATKGLIAAWREQPNLRIHSVALIAVTVVGFYFNISASECAIILLAAGLVIGLELVNTAIENLTDLVTREQNPLAGKVKDISAAAVLVASIVALIIASLIFYSHL